jgi:hypothetical protein
MRGGIDPGKQWSPDRTCGEIVCSFECRQFSKFRGKVTGTANKPMLCNLLRDDSPDFIRIAALLSLVIYRGHNVVIGGSRLYRLVTVDCVANRASQQLVRAPHDRGAVHIEANEIRRCAPLPG